MKKNNKVEVTDVKKDVQASEGSHFKNGHRWLATIMGLTTAWTLVTFLLGLCSHADLPCRLQYLNVWYLVNMGVITVLGCYSTLTILKKCASQIFWSGTTMFVIVLQTISLVVYFFYQQDTAAINAIAMFVWAICWYGYMVTAPAVEADLPSRHRSHGKVGEVILCVMAASTVAYGVIMCINLLW